MLLFFPSLLSPRWHTCRTRDIAFLQSCSWQRALHSTAHRFSSSTQPVRRRRACSSPYSRSTSVVYLYITFSTLAHCYCASYLPSQCRSMHSLQAVAHAPSSLTPPAASSNSSSFSNRSLLFQSEFQSFEPVAFENKMTQILILHQGH